MTDETQSDDRRKKLDEWFSIAYSELRKLASMVKSNDANASLSTSTLVHSAWIKLAASSGAGPESKLHFKRTAAKVMRNIVVDGARRRIAEKRGGGAAFITLDDSVDVPVSRNLDLLALDSALERLAAQSKRQAEIVELRFYADLTTAEISHVLGIAETTVERDWRLAKAWLRSEMRKSR